MTFDDLGLSPEVLRAIEEVGYTTPTPIQEKAIPYVLMGRDVLGCAQTGTGKTASFTLPMIDILAEGRAKARMPRSVIIEPTRELAAQVGENFDTYGKYHKLSKALLIGGSSFTDQLAQLDRGVDVLIATPGRLLDLFDRGKILLADVKILVIDETDRMLDMGFIPDVERIVSLLPVMRQTLFFSATMPKEIRRLADSFLMNPKEISVSPPASAATTIDQRVLRMPGQDKRKALKALMDQSEVTGALIFCNRKRDVAALAKALQQQGYSADGLHGDMTQPARMETLEKFRKGAITYMVCSDVAARGLDIPAVSHVFNYDVPGNPEDYVHRIGRTGRAGRKGCAYTFASPADAKALAGIVRILGKDIPEMAIEGVRALSIEDVELSEEAAGKGRRRGRGKTTKSGETAKRSEAKAPETVEAESKADAAAEVEAQPETVTEAAESKPARRSRSGRGGRKAKVEAAEKQAPEAVEAETRTHDIEAREDESGRSAEGRQGEKRGRHADQRRGGGKSTSKKSEQPSAGSDKERRPGPGSHPSKTFGEHTPAFLLRPVPLSVSA